jgi:dolichyl-phosphate-mannose--protein O-mannosyl transferase
VPRISFIYHFLPAAIFGCLSVAWTVSDLVRRGRWGRIVGWSYVGLVLAACAYFYPIRAAVPISQDAFEQRLWSKRWR